MMPNIAQNMMGLQPGMFQQGLSPVGQSQTGMHSSGVNQGSRKDDKDRGGRERDRSDVEDRRDRRDRGHSSRWERSR